MLSVNGVIIVKVGCANMINNLVEENVATSNEWSNIHIYIHIYNIDTNLYVSLYQEN